jgi:ribosomal-protein-alanine N-acetyltransferase
MPEIETARLRFRQLCVDDLDDLWLIVSDSEVMKYLGVIAGTILSREETQVTLEKMLEFWAVNGLGRWAVVDKKDGKLIGLCGFRLFDTTPELFYLFNKESWGKGLATEAARATLRYGFEELGVDRIIAVTRHANQASINVMTKLGMKYEKEMNHFGVFAVWYVATRDEYQIDDSTYILSRG